MNGNGSTPLPGDATGNFFCSSATGTTWWKRDGEWHDTGLRCDMYDLYEDYR